MDEARRNEEVISLADSQVLRWIDEINGVIDGDARAKEIKHEIKRLRREPNSTQNKRQIRALYKQLDNIQFKPDYMCLIIDKKQDYYRACKGFSINGIRYKRLLGTNGGIKDSTIVFLSERVIDEVRRRIENGRNPNMELVTAKLEAYKALACSASIPVTMPNGILVVDDCETNFVSDVIYLSDENENEPVMEERIAQEITLDASDGFGLMSPELAERWSKELGLSYTMSGCNTRFSYEKGMVYVFPFIEFADKIAGGRHAVKDAWGDDKDIRDVELILTTSMVKLWDSYESCDDYITKSLNNGYTFGVTKTCPRELESERSLNYQFIQPFKLSDDDIEELIGPTMDDIRDVLGGDWRKTILFLKGTGLNERNVKSLDDDFAKAIMIDRRILDDPFVQSSIYRIIKNRIDEAKVGVLKVHGNYSMASGDPFALCQSIFGLEVTGLLRAGEIYNQYWIDNGAGKLVCFRAPMTCANNIRLVRPVDNEDVRYWYRYINTATIFNAWDTATSALNGMDYDGDLVMLTDNNVLVNRAEPLPALMCAQRKATKRISSEEDFIKSNIESFGNDIGATTNWITSMFEVRSHFEEGSKEYEELSYRIQSGQLFQQNAIDKAKGIICKPMPRTWHDWHTVLKIEDEEAREFYRTIMADKKPYFMRYIYPKLMKEYRKYLKNTTINSLRRFGLTVDELRALSQGELTEEQAKFLKYYDKGMPVGIGDCTMNKICRRFEEEFDGHIGKHNSKVKFDYTFMRNSSEWARPQYTAIKQLYEEYNQRLQDYKISSKYERKDKGESAGEIILRNIDFAQRCAIICPNSEVLCNILLDICYTRSATKQFAWSMAGSDIIHNMLEKNDNKISFPTLDKSGDFEYGGNKFSVKTIQIGEDNVDSIE